MLQKKTGRLASPDSKHTMFRVRLDDTSVAKLSECSEKIGVTRSEIIRKGIDKMHDDLSKT